MKNTMIRCVFLLLSLLSVFVLILIFKAYRENISTDNDIIIRNKDDFLTDLNYNVIISNKSKSGVYFRSSPELFSCGIYDNEKVHYVTMTPNRNPKFYEIYVPFAPYFNIETEIETDTTRVFKVRGDVNNKNYHYETDKERGIAENQYPELCSDIHIIFFFTRNPYKLDSYPEYIEVMKKDGYAVLGNRVSNDFYFIITDVETRVNDDAINDLLLFIHKYLYPSNLSSSSLRDREAQGAGATVARLIRTRERQ